MLRAGRFALRWLSVAVAGVLCGLVVEARAENVGITGRKLVILDKLEFINKAAVRFLSVDPLVRKGFGTSPSDIGATIDITIEALNHPPIAGAFSVPQGFSTTAGWRVNNSSLAKYVNPGSPGGPTQVRVMTIQQSHLIKLAARGLGDLPLNLDDLRFAPYDVQVRVTILNGDETFTHCTVFDSDDCRLPEAGAGTGRKMQCAHGQPVFDCIFPAVQ
jgi:hypothetical protein